jgi:hypothetical protein
VHVRETHVLDVVYICSSSFSIARDNLQSILVRHNREKGCVREDTIALTRGIYGEKHWKVVFMLFQYHTRLPVPVLVLSGPWGKLASTDLHPNPHH